MQGFGPRRVKKRLFPQATPLLRSGHLGIVEGVGFPKTQIFFWMLFRVGMMGTEVERLDYQNSRSCSI